MGWNTFVKIKTSLFGHELELKTRWPKYFDLSVVLNGVEIWTMNVSSINKFEFFEIVMHHDSLGKQDYKQ